jgi:hypothetical protein
VSRAGLDSRPPAPDGRLCLPELEFCLVLAAGLVFGAAAAKLAITLGLLSFLA